jgi:hypothetical protein
VALTGSAILGADDIKTQTVPVPEWGGDVLVRGLTGAELDAYQGSMRQMRPRLDGKGMEMVLLSDNNRAKLLVKCLVNESGERLFADTDAPALGRKSAAALDRLYDVAAELSGLSDESAEEIEGNSEAPTQDGASTSPSPENSAAPSPSS